MIRSAIAILVSSAAAWAQSSSAVLSGTVSDQQDMAIGSAKVTLLDPARGQTRQASTDANGVFVFSQLAPSMYELSAWRLLWRHRWTVGSLRTNLSTAGVFRH